VPEGTENDRTSGGYRRRCRERRKRRSPVRRQSPQQRRKERTEGRGSPFPYANHRQTIIFAPV